MAAAFIHACILLHKTQAHVRPFLDPIKGSIAVFAQQSKWNSIRIMSQILKLFKPVSYATTLQEETAIKSPILIVVAVPPFLVSASAAALALLKSSLAVLLLVMPSSSLLLVFLMPLSMLKLMCVLTTMNVNVTEGLVAICEVVVHIDVDVLAHAAASACKLWW